MARYIDADKLMESIERDTEPYKSWDCTKFEVAMETIKNAPTVDVAEVKHGEWISLTECSNAGVYCSVCHKKVYKEDYAWCNKRNKLRSNYCPNCGAKMDGGKAE